MVLQAASSSMDTPRSLPIPSQGVPCPGGLPTHRSTLEFRKLCIDGDLSKIKQFLSHQREIEDATSSSVRTGPPFRPYDGFREAIRCGSVQVVKYLISEGFSLLTTGPYYIVESAIKGAASSGQIEMLDFFVEQGWDPKRSEFPDPEVDPSLKPQFSLISSALDSERIVRWFLDQGVDANVKTYGGRTAISDACRAAPLSMVKLLVELGAADVKDKDVVAQAAIGHNNGVPGRLEVVEYVLNLGAPINMYANDKLVGSFWFSYVAVTGLETALQHAAKAGKEDMVKLLLERGADKSLRAGFQRSPKEKLKTALEVAEEKGFDNVIKLLR